MMRQLTGIETVRDDGIGESNEPNATIALAAPAGLHGLPAANYERVTRVAARALRASLVMIALPGEAGARFETVAGPDDIQDQEGQLRLARMLCARIFATGEELSVSDGARTASSCDEIGHASDVAACLGIPLRGSNGDVFGSLCVMDSAPRDWTEEDRALLTDLASLFESEIDLNAEIQRRRSAEETSELVTRELTHRIKNIFTVVASLVALSVRSHPEARGFAKSVGDRISALAQAHDYVRPAQGMASAASSAQSLLGLIAALMTPYQESGRTRISLRGEDAPVGKRAVTTFALVLHELATNAVKYGALSSPAGSVVIRCEKTSEALVLTWQEQDGPKVNGPPTQQGFGTVLSGRAATAQLGATVHHDWRPQGLVFRMDIPLARLAM